MLSLVAAGPITWQLAMSSPFSEPVPSPGGLSEPLGRPASGTDIPGPGLAISGVSRTYDTDEGPVAALGPVELHVPQGRFVTLIGPSGCGKSTLLRILAGIDQPDQGSISIFGESVEQHAQGQADRVRPPGTGSPALAHRARERPTSSRAQPVRRGEPSATGPRPERGTSSARSRRCPRPPAR